jgi:hypothetical protein
MEQKTNERLELARRIIEGTGTSLFLTGKAGTGKTTFLRNLRSSSRKRIVVCAPTGIAAINAGGVTLHSFFQLDFGPFVPGMNNDTRRKFSYSKEKLRIIRGMDLLVIDEVSMVRADLLDAVDDVLRRLRDRTKPFGGVQLLLIGDLQQLAPVVREEERHLLEGRYKSLFFFDSVALQQLPYETVELNEVFRQKDADFLGMLNAIRENRADKTVLDKLNSRCIPGFNPGDDEGYIRLTTHNGIANDINRQKLDELPAQPHVFECHIEGKFPETSYPADPELTLKVGAQVMFIKNDTGMDRSYYNGMIGQVVAIDEEYGVAVRPQEGGEIIQVQPVDWDNISYTVNPETKEIVEHKEGTFTQFPLKLAWAVTIHKSQGLTFDRAIIDVKRSFAHGQTYVALSRCRTLQGLVLENPVSPSSIINDTSVDRFYNDHNCDDIDEAHLDMLERQYKVGLLDDLFNFRQMFAAMEGVMRLYQENFMRKFPAIVQDWVQMYETKSREINKVADTFRHQYSCMAMEGSRSEQVLGERVKAACKYFVGQLMPVVDLATKAIRNSDNKAVRSKLQDRLELFEDLLTAKRMLLNNFISRQFSIDVYLDLKAEVMLRNVTPKPTRETKKKTRKATMSDSKPMLSDSKPMLPDEEFEEIDRYVHPENYEWPDTPAPAKKQRRTDQTLNSPNLPITPNTPITPKSPKPVKKPTTEITLELYRQGKSVSDIAEIRGLVRSTITGHLLKTLPDQDLEEYVRKNIDEELRARVKAYLDDTPILPDTISGVREAIGGEPAWDDIRFLLRYYHRELTPLLQNPAADSAAIIANEPPASYGTPSDFIEEE